MTVHRALGIFIVAGVSGSLACSGGTGVSADGAAGGGGRAALTGAAGASGAAGSGSADAASGSGTDAPGDRPTPGADAGRDAPGNRADGSALGACLGVCLESFLFDCQKSLGCVSTTSEMEIVSCYSNGVKERKTFPAIGTTGTLKKADGSLCYSFTKANGVQTYLDLDGHEVARLTNGPTDYLYRLTCRAEPERPIDLHIDACAERYALTTQTCTPGACTF